MGLYILTGSQQFGLLSGISQSLAGRVGMMQLLPFSSQELQTADKLPENLDSFCMDFHSRGKLHSLPAPAAPSQLQQTAGQAPPKLYFHDTGNEVDVIVDLGLQLVPIGVKSGQTISADYFSGLRKWLSWAGAGRAYLVYGGDESQQRKEGQARPCRGGS